jgi:nitroreductase
MQNKERSSYQALETIIQARRSCRAFLPKPVPRTDIERVLELAQRSPSDCNIQPWHIYVVEGRLLDEIKEALYAEEVAGIAYSYDVKPIENYSSQFLERKRDCGWSLYGALGIRRGDREASRLQALENYHFFGAPNAAFLTSHVSTGERGIFDAGIYLGHLLLSIEAAGLAAVPQAAIAFRAGTVRQLVHIPDQQRLICAVAFGYAQPDHPANRFRLGRAPLGQNATFIEA